MSTKTIFSLPEKLKDDSQIVFDAEVPTIFELAGKFVSFQTRFKRVNSKRLDFCPKRVFAFSVSGNPPLERAFE